ncbi:hypothetical protein CLV32_2036 [Pedobacter duraquae]|uniref:Uncharacterized protein n=1 Tax=Pedobacter duraquae TaxID=425511 RepID=A0A4R6ILN0_9SPHI|nr:hypothetical protein CLV32_2036 [Pedobacter duraquae]
MEFCYLHTKYLIMSNTDVTIIILSLTLVLAVAALYLTFVNNKKLNH